MNWFLPDDGTRPVITAADHVKSGHGGGDARPLPPTCVLFEMGGAIRRLEERHPATVLSERLPCFLEMPRCIALTGRETVCFTRGGYGAPAAVDTLETLRALGVRRIVVAGLCGVFAPGVEVGDIIAPRRVRSEEGTSRHYVADGQYAYPDPGLLAAATAFFECRTDPIVTTDAVYRQTLRKEALWRGEGCVGVEMETSALLTVSRCYGMPAVALLLASDKHPFSDGEPGWRWGADNFRDAKTRFVEGAAAFAFSLPALPEGKNP